MSEQDRDEIAFFAALKANVDRPPLLPFEEDVLDGYVWGLEQAAYCVAKALNKQDLIDKYLPAKAK